MVNRRFPVLLLAAAFLLAAAAAFAAENGWGDAESLLAEVDQAVADESYTRAIGLIEEGRLRFPADSRLPRRAGDMYRERELYRLALAEYRTARDLNPADPSILLDIAAVHGYLGDNIAAVESLEGLLVRLERENNSEDAELRREAVDDLSWMYFKTHRMEDGIALLEGALEENFDRSWAHTLGTLYSGIYDLEASRRWYNAAIDDALDSGDEYFASVAFYNLSLLEFSFYRYEEARRRAERSLELRSRAGGHLVLGELDFLAWDTAGALTSYQAAEEMDDTPLALLDLAAYHRRMGFLDEALLYVGKADRGDDESWMYHYGLDRLRFDIDVSGVLAEAWKGKAKTEALVPRTGLPSRLRSLADRISWRILGMYHDRRNRALTDRLADQLAEEAQDLDAAWNAALAHRGYRRSVLGYLEEARNLERAIAPECEPWYDLEIGVETNDADLILEASGSFLPEERDPVERSLREAALRLSGRRSRTLRADLLTRLYAMNPGGLRQYGLSLPVAVVATGDVPAILRHRIVSVLRRTGYDTLPAERAGPAASVLTVAADPSGTLRWYLADPAGRTRSSAETGRALSRRDAAAVLSGILDGFYAAAPEGLVR